MIFSVWAQVGLSLIAFHHLARLGDFPSALTRAWACLTSH
jgi:hypothetical protein